MKNSKNPNKKLSSYKLTEVISIVSHQLKTPLSAIKGCIEVMISEDLGPINLKQREYLGDALENTKRMIDLVKDLLDVSKIEEGRLDLNPKQTDITNIIKEVIKDFSTLARARNCTINLKIDGVIPKLNIDPIKITQVISNLIGNAIDYSPGKSEIDIILKQKGRNLVFCCKDSGVGIPEKEKDKIFTKFYRSGKAMSLATGGSGLGLFISKAIINKSKGKIWFVSKENQGSSFYFSLPLTK